MVESTNVSEEPAASTFLVKLLHLRIMGKKRCAKPRDYQRGTSSLHLSTYLRLATSIHTDGERGSELLTDSEGRRYYQNCRFYSPAYNTTKEAPVTLILHSEGSRVA
jgi:hypothetical protein